MNWLERILLSAALVLAIVPVFVRVWLQRRVRRERQVVYELLLRSDWMTGGDMIDASAGRLDPGVYGTLRQMESEGVLMTRTEYMNLDVRNGRPRICYSLAAKHR